MHVDVCYTYIFVILLQVNLKPQLLLLHHLQLLLLLTPINAHPVSSYLIFVCYNVYSYVTYVYIDDT